MVTMVVGRSTEVELCSFFGDLALLCAIASDHVLIETIPRLSIAMILLLIQSYMGIALNVQSKGYKNVSDNCGYNSNE